MNVLYVILGVISLAFGVILTIKEIKIIKGGTQDPQGFDIKLLASGISFIIIGIALIVKYI